MSEAIQKTVIAGEIIKKNLTEQEAADKYGMSVHWYRRARWQGDGPRFIKLAGSVLYPVTELDAYFDSRLVKSTSEVTSRKIAAVREA
jgi:predicted DNA-binding transcriptional regulator AlpA